MCDGRLSGNEEIEREMKKLNSEFSKEKIPDVMRLFMRRFRDEGTLLVRIFPDSKDYKEETNDYYASYIEELKECWCVGCTNQEESEGMGAFREVSWEEFFRTVRASSFMTGAVINPSGSRFVVPQEMMGLILDAWDQMDDNKILS